MELSLSHLPTIALIAPTLACAAIAYAVYRFNTRISPNIPYAGEGSLLSRLRVPIEFGADPIALLCKTRKQLGDVFCVDMFAFRLVYMLGTEANKEVLRAAEEDLSLFDPSTWAFGPAFTEIATNPAFVSFTSKFFKTGLSKADILEANFTKCKPIAESHFERWAKQGTIPLFQSISEVIVSMSIVFSFGPDFFEKYGKEFVPMMIEFEQLVQTPILRFVPGTLWWLTSPGRNIFRLCQRVDEMTKDEVGALAADPQAAASRVDYFARVIHASGGPHNNRFSLNTFGRHVQSMVFAARANSANTIPWMLLHAYRHPNALERIREEVLAKKEETLKHPGRVSRPYLDACLRETGRLYTNTTMLRQTRKPMRLLGHNIPANTFVALSPLAMQRAGAGSAYDAGPGTTIYKNAGSWDPERFLANDGCDYNEWFRRHEFVQFGAQIHACPGEKVAKMFIFDLIFQTWFENYDVEVVSGLKEGERGLDGVGAVAAWSEDNIGTPGISGEDIMVSVKRRSDKS